MRSRPLISANAVDEGSREITSHEPHPWGMNGMGPMMPSFEKMAQRMSQVTQANEEQKKKLLSLAQEGDKKMPPLQEAIKKGHDVCMQLMMASQLDLSAIKKAHQAQAQNKQNMQDMHFSYLLAAMQVLTPAQRQQWLKEMQAHPHRGAASSMGQNGKRRSQKAAAMGNQAQAQND
jgi:Spy/CpxP family protein refolding chaperone